MNNYYLLSGELKRKTAFAYSACETPVSYELIPHLKKEDELPFDLVLRRVELINGEVKVSDDMSGVECLWTDYQPNEFAWPLFSENLKNIIIDNLTGNEDIIWIKAIIKLGDERRLYFIPRFRRKLDVIDEQKTLFVKGTDHIIRPVFSLEKVIKYNMFHKPQLLWEVTSGIYVSEKMKEAIQKEKMSVSFEKTRVE